MHVFLGVENFAKIKSARICIDSYTLLVGPNNSGKTFLMQLVQGMHEKIINLIDDDVLPILKQNTDTFSDIAKDSNTRYTSYIISQDNILQFITYLNKKIDENKEQLIKEIFGKEIPIKKLFIEIFLDIKESYEIVLFNDKNQIEELIASLWKTHGKISDLLLRDSLASALIRHGSERGDGKLLLFAFFESGNDTHLVKSNLRVLLEDPSLFLPASRTGLMLLYREFFANKTDSMISYEIGEKQFIKDRNIYGNLTQPIYQFLRFLQTYTGLEERNKLYKNEIEFFEQKLIEGHIRANEQNGFFYNPSEENMNVPLYMASSMVNEIAPIVLALTDSRAYRRLIIDEIEASLHPKKQLELVRFLNRLNNKGIKLILSTHSDTFASKINNLFLLSEYAVQHQDFEIVNKMGLEKEDLMDTGNFFVYEFINQPNGQSIVKEITRDKTTGYQFDLFTDSAMHLYGESLKIGEILQNDNSEHN